MMTEASATTNDLPLLAFTADLVASLTGLSISQLHRWDRSDFFHPSLADPNRRRPHSRIYSLSDVVALRTIAELRKAGVSFAELKKIRSSLVPNARGEWTVRCFHVVGNRVFLSRKEALAAVCGGLRGEPLLVDLDVAIADVESAVRRLSERRPEQIGQVTRNRWIMGGVPIIAGTRIPTATVVWFQKHGYSVDSILEEFPRLTPEDVQAAVTFEIGSDLADRELVLAQGSFSASDGCHDPDLVSH